jgi:hypothetical protein
MNNSAASTLIWAGAIVFGVGVTVGLTPLTLGDYSCGSAWFPGGCNTGMLDSSTTISMVLLLIGAAAAIAGLVVRGNSQSLGE